MVKIVRIFSACLHTKQAFAGDFHHRSKQLQGYRSACARLVSGTGKCDGGVMSGAAGGGGGAGAAVRQGHLRKLKTMKKKFFVLRGESADCSARLEYYESEKKCRAGAAPRRVLPLKSCYNITRRLDLKQKHVIALFTKEEQFCIVAENEQELHAWLSALLKQHHSDDASDELLHPTQHVWQVNVQKKGLGAVKNIHGLYNLCLTDKTLTLVKIKSLNNVISELGIPERIEYSLKNIRRCGDSECFFYMEVGRQTATGAGELWMHSDDSNIAQSMHSTIYHAMRNCAKETENERDHIVIPKNENALPARRQTYSDGRGRAGLTSEKGLCVGACIRQCVCASATHSIEESAAALAPLATHAECQANNTLTECGESARAIKHHRTVSLPTGAGGCLEPLRVVHERTRSAPLTGAELDTLLARPHCPGKPNGVPLPGKHGAARRASTGMRLCKLSPAHSKNAGTLRNRCDSMPSRACSSFDIERPPPSHNDLEAPDESRDEPDAAGEWSRTPRIPEEPDVYDITRDWNMYMTVKQSRTSSLGVEDHVVPEGYMPMAGHEATGLVSASSGSVCSGTPSTDPRFSEYQLEPATSHIGYESRPPRAYSVGSRPAPRAEHRHRAYSVGARAKPAAHRVRASAEDLMLLDFSNKSPATKPPMGAAGVSRSPAACDEYVTMTSPRGTRAGDARPGDAPGAGYVEMRPGEIGPAPATPHGYVEMTYGKSRPIAIAAVRAPPPPAASPDDRFRRKLDHTSTHGSQIFEFSGSLESPVSPAEARAGAESPPHLATVREGAEDAARPSPRHADAAEAAGGERVVTSRSPQYVTLKPELGCNPTANKCLLARQDTDNTAECISGAVVVVAGAGGAARFAVGGAPPAPCEPGAAPLHYAALDLEPRHKPAPLTPRTYTQIDFIRSEKLHTGAGDAT